MKTTIDSGVFTPEDLLKARSDASRANNSAYNWDELADLFTTGNFPHQVAKDLLYIYFTVTTYYINDVESCGGNESLGEALYTIRGLYDAISSMTGEDQNNGLLCFISKFDLKSE